MASLFKKPRSPFWWIKFRDPNTGKICYESTGFKIGPGPEKQRAMELEAEKTLAERATGRVHRSECWDVWVRTFLEAHYSQNPASLTRYLTAWRTVELFFREQKILAPRFLTREHCTHYFQWRKKPDTRNRKYRAGHNTALLEMKTIGLVMKEARRRGYCHDNPARELGMKRAPRKLFPEMTDEVMTLILQKIPEEREPLQTFLRNSFLIARWHGVRLNETFLNPKCDVWQQEIKGESRWMILFRQKGGRERPKLLHPELIPLFQKLRADGATVTYEKPENPSREWFDFLHRCGAKAKLPNVCFHSLRVTAATRLARAGVPERKAMEYLTHASTTVHQAYIRWQPEDMEECHGALGS